MVVVRGHLGDDETGRLGHGKVEVEVEAKEEKKVKVGVKTESTLYFFISESPNVLFEYFQSIE